MPAHIHFSRLRRATFAAEGTKCSCIADHRSVAMSEAAEPALRGPSTEKCVLTTEACDTKETVFC